MTALFTDMATLIQKQQPQLTAIKLATVKYAGMLSGSDYLVSCEPATPFHPLADLMDGNVYLKAMKDAFNLFSITSKGSKKSRLVTPKTVQLVSYNSLQTWSPTFSTQQIGLGEQTEKQIIIPSDGRNEFSFNIDFTVDGFNLTGGILHAGGIAAVRNTGSDACCRRLTMPTNKFFRLAYPDLADTATPISLMKLTLDRVGAFGEDSLPSLGVGAYFLKDNPSSQLRDVTKGLVPQIPGTRRWLVAQAFANGILILTGYMIGSGNDAIYYDIVATDGGNGDSPPGGRRMRGAKYHQGTYPTNAADLRRTADIELETWWPLSWSSDFISSIEAKMTLGSVVDLDPVGNTFLKHQQIDAEVTLAKGQFNKPEVAKYLDGFGVYPALKAAERDQYLAKLGDVPDSVLFAITKQPCGGRSLKELPFYREYAKKRAKACKTNNFMELPYNDEFTMKQVENKLSNLSVLNVTARDASLGSVTPVKLNLPAITRVTTIAKVTDTSFSYTVNDAGFAGTIILSEQNLEKWLDEVSPSKFTGDVAMIDAFIVGLGGGSLADFSTAANGESFEYMSLSTKNHSFGQGVIYSSVVENLPVDGQIGYLCDQVTLYRHFNVRLPLFLRSLMGSEVYPKLLTEFK